MRSLPFGLVLLAGVAFAALVAQGQRKQTSVAGCLTEFPNGTLVLGVVPSGNVYSLRGSPQMLLAHRQQLVRVYGYESSGDNQQPEFTVTKLEVLADTCTAPLPSSHAAAVTGKTGEHGAAIPDTTTATAGTVTPGIQTGAGIAQQPGIHTEVNAENTPPAKAPLAPPNFAQAGQSEQEANRGAEAAARAEVVPGQTLGVSTPAPPPTAAPAPAQTARPASPAATATRQVSTKPVVVEMKGEELKFVPPKVTIRVGQTIEWVNSSKEVHNVVGDPSKVLNRADVQLPAGSEPFASEFMQPGNTFKHTFTKPGLYRYVCTLHEVQHMRGEVVVQK